MKSNRCSVFLNSESIMLSGTDSSCAALLTIRFVGELLLFIYTEKAFCVHLVM